MKALESMSDEELLNEYTAEVACEDRRCSFDPPSEAPALSDEILKRMKHGR